MIRSELEKLPDNLVELVRRRAAEQPEKLAYLFLADGEREEARLTFAALDREARSIGAALQALDAAGERVLLLYPPGLDYICAFLGCLYAGAIAVPAYPPRRNRNAQRLHSIFADSGAALALTGGALAAEVRSRVDSMSGLRPVRWLETSRDGGRRADDWREPLINAETLAFLQYTSGSTATPKGVMVSHGNLLYNERMIQLAYDHSAETVFAGWLPLYHDMGLIGNVLQPLWLGIPSILMPPVAFLQKPLRWLQAISRYGATTSGGPDFAYRLCVQRISPEEREALDLSRWSVAFNGAEPVRAETLDEFAAAFASCGFRRAAFCPCYGLAEATLLASGGSRGAAPLAVSGPALGQNRVETVAAGDPAARRLVGCGTTWLGQEIAIADPERLTRCAPGEVGEIWLAGPNVTHGYWGREEETARTFGARLAPGGEGPFLRTGDLGFLRGGELFVTGRRKDLIILRGVNHYPQDIERTAEGSHPALSPGSNAAFSIEAGGEERLVLVQEVRRDFRQPGPAEIEAVARAVRSAVAEEHEAQVHTVVLLRHGSIAKTSSGKIQRQASRAAFLAGELLEVGRSAVDALPEAAEAGGEGPGPLPPGPERRAWLQLFLREEAARALRLPLARVDPAAPLSALGLDSLTAVELQSRLEAGLGIPLPAAGLLDGPSLEELAGEVLARLDAPPAAEGPALVPGPIEGSQPVSYGQRALWSLHQQEPESPAYNIALAVRLRSGTDLSALRAALRELAGRHPALRTTFEASAEGVVAARVHGRVEPDLIEHEARDWAAAALAGHLSVAAHAPFDLEKGPLLRAGLYHCADGEAVLLLVIHHIVADLGSLGLLLRELGALYTAGRRGRDAALPPPRLSYGDYARWQAQRLAGPEGERLWEYWRGRLQGELPLLDLPFDRPRPALPRGGGGLLRQRLDAALAADLAELGRARRATLFTVLLAGFQALLHRHTGQSDLLVGSPMAGRERPELAGIVGYFVNSVVLRGDCAGDPPFAALLAQAREAVHGAFEHQGFPFSLLVERLQPERDPGRAPLFQAVLVMQQIPLLESAGAAALALGEAGPPVALDDLVVESEPFERPVVPFDLTLSVAEAGGPLLVSWQYRRDLFDPATLARIAGHFANLLAGAVRDPHLGLSELPLLGEPERHQLVIEQPAVPAAAGGGGDALHPAFVRQARRRPEAVAVTCEGAHLTYAELDRRSGRLARRLRRLGVGPEVRVGVCLEPSLDLIVALLGVLKAGGAYLPLDPEYPAERLRFMMEDAHTPVVVTAAGLRDRVPAGSAALVLIEALLAAEEAGEPAPAAPLPDAAAYVIYTSGSTGRPKGVVVPHRQVLRLFAATAEWFRFSERDVWTLFHSYAFDFSVWEIWGALLHGGRLVVVPRWLGRAPEAFRALLAEERVTVLNQTPTAFYQLVRAEAGGAAIGAAPPLALRQVIFGGEALEPERLAPWVERHGDREPRLVNMYGITETTVHVTFRPIEAGDLGRPASPIGVAIPDLRAYVLSPSLRPVPLGVAGELAVGGAGLARGYLARPDLTAARFCPDPFGAEPGARLYRSGDLVRRRAGGELEYLGRIDQQVKVRGFRIELGEIEAALRRHPAVREAVVMVRHDAPGDQINGRLAAYLVSRGEALPVEALRGYLRETLPEHMVPAVFVELDALPLSPSGKVDRRALPEPSHVRPGLEQERVAPRNRAEARLAEVWSEVLDLADVGVTDNFFALGGDSILSIQVVARARQRGYRLTPRQAFEHQTIAELAAVAVEVAEAGEKGASRETAATYPLTPLQQGLLFHSAYEPGLDEYLVQVLCQIDGALDAAAFEAAWRLAIAGHPVLRTAFRWQGLAAPVQVVEETAALPCRHEDWRFLTAAEQERRLAGLLADDRRRGFDLAQAPLLRLTLARLADERHRLLVSFHHLILDGWSTAALLKEVLTSYEALQAGRAPSPPPAPPFGDYLAWLAGQDPGEAEGFWRRLLRGFEVPTPLPADRPAGAAGGPPDYRERRLTLGPGATARLAAFARQHRLTQSTLVQGAWSQVLARHAGESDVVFGATVAGRPAELPGVEAMLGLLINTLPVRVALEAARPLLPWLADLQEQLVEMRQYEHSALGAVQGWSGVPRGQALFETIVIFESYPLDRSLLGRRGALAVSDVRSVEWTHYPLSLTALPGDELVLQAVYDLRRFDDATAARLLGHVESFLNGLEPGLRLADLALLTAAEEQQVRREWNDSRTARGEDACIHERIAATAARRGDAVAVEEVSGDGAGRRWSYRELERRADQLADRLRLQGVGPEVLVGLCVERRLEMVAAHLAVLKAGGGYVPLDPAYPAARLAFMLEDARVPVLVTERRLLPSLPPHPARVVLIDEEEPALQAAPHGAAPLWSGVVPDNVSHVIYTSGSTGVPKAVVIPHRSLTRFVDTAIRLYDLRPGDRVLQFGSISFDAATEEIYTALAAGATLVLRTETMLASTAAFLDECAALGITVLDLPTAFWHPICAGLAAGLRLPAGLRSVVIAGERAAPERLAEWLRHAPPGIRLTNAYGPTEGTIVASAFRPEPGDEARREVPIGRPIGNARVHLLDAGGQAVPPGAAGELCIGGDGVTRGYFRRPDLTAERFVPDPFGEEPSARLYRTGDLARHLADGTLELAGRIDHQVKIRGFRVELGEVESALLQHPAVREAAVHPWPTPEGGKRLVAYVVPAPGAPAPGAQELRRHLLEQLPPYMVPAAFQLLAALPLTASGSKLDRRALPPPEDVRPATAAEYQPPRTEIEARLAEIWSQVLGVERVGTADSFFELGGDSILSLQATARAHQAGLRFTPKQLFECQTIGELAAVVEILPAAGGVLADPGPVTGELPLTPIQEWFFQLGLPRPGHWNQAVLLQVAPEARMDPPAWRRAIATLLEHHDALRFTFPAPAEGQAWKALAGAAGTVPFTFCDLSALPAEIQESSIPFSAALAQTSLGLEGPLLRAVYFHLGADRPARLLLAIHHLVVDGVSWRILLEDLTARRLPPKTSSFQQWAKRLRAYADSPAVEPEIGHWLSATSGGPPLPRDLDGIGNAEGNTEGDLGVVRVALEPAETQALLKEVPPAYGTEINDALLAALLRVLTAWTGSPELLIELEGHGREPLFETIDVSRTVGWFTTAFPVRLELPAEDDPGTTLKAVKEQLRAVPGRGIGYGLLRYLRSDPALRRQLERLPRPEVGFNYLGQLDQVLGGGSPFTLAPEPAGPARDPGSPRTHVLEIESRVSAGRLEIEWLYSRRLHRAETIERLAGGYLAELRALIEHCRAREERGFTPSDFPQMGFDQRELDALLDDLAASLGAGG